MNCEIVGFDEQDGDPKDHRCALFCTAEGAIISLSVFWLLYATSRPFKIIDMLVRNVVFELQTLPARADLCRSLPIPHVRADRKPSKPVHQFVYNNDNNPHVCVSTVG